MNTAEEQEEKVTKLERDVWVSAFGWAAAWGQKDPEYWAALAVLKLRYPNLKHPVDESGSARAPRLRIRVAVEAYDARNHPPTNAELEAEGREMVRTRRRRREPIENRIRRAYAEVDALCKKLGLVQNAAGEFEAQPG